MIGQLGTISCSQSQDPLAKLFSVDTETGPFSEAADNIWLTVLMLQLHLFHLFLLHFYTMLITNS